MGRSAVAGSKKRTLKIQYEGEEEDEEEEGGGYLEEEGEDAYPVYRVVRRTGGTVNGFTLTPCGVCPVFDKCTPTGVISPSTCVYIGAWLENS